MTFFRRDKMKLKIYLLAAMAFLAVLSGCEEETASNDPSKILIGKISIDKQPFGQLADGTEVDIYTLKNANGMTAKITNYGGIVTELYAPDRKGKFQDVVLGYENLEKYLESSPYFGALIGRYGNRIAKGKFAIDGIEYTLTANEGENHIHGGQKGFDKVVWKTQAIATFSGPSLILTYLSKDGEEGYPGNLKTRVIYTLTNDNELKISYEAQTDKTTVVNLTHHGYYNLAGHKSGDILGHELMISADNFTPVDERVIPTGRIIPVADSPLDFRESTPIGSRIDQVTGGYDHNYVLNNKIGNFAKIATVYEPKSGRVMEVSTSLPGLQFYSGNFLDATSKGKGATYKKHSGFCLSTQRFPDSPNNPKFPSAVLKPGQKYHSLTSYKFSTRPESKEKPKEESKE